MTISRVSNLDEERIMAGKLTKKIPSAADRSFAAKRGLVKGATSVRTTEGQRRNFGSSTIVEKASAKPR